MGLMDDSVAFYLADGVGIQVEWRLIASVEMSMDRALGGKGDHLGVAGEGARSTCSKRWGVRVSADRNARGQPGVRQRKLAGIQSWRWDDLSQHSRWH